MKKLYRKGTVHPTPPDHLLSFLPAAILTLTAALSLEDREVLAYLISCSSSSSSNNHHPRKKKSSAAAAASDHAPSFNCNCFRCYMSYWVKWDTSPNRQLIHEIIDAFEDSLIKDTKTTNSRKERRKGRNVQRNVINPESKKSLTEVKEEFSFDQSKAEVSVESEVEDDVSSSEDEEGELERGSVRRFVSFLGERIWGVWGN